MRGADAVAAIFKGRAQAAQLALVDGASGLVFAPGGQPYAVFEFGIKDGRIVEVSLIADPDVIRRLDVNTATA